MTPADEKLQPTRSEIADLKQLASGIIRAQGNRFVKELLRGKIRIGTNKAEFERNLTEAIEKGQLTLIMVYRIVSLTRNPRSK